MESKIVASASRGRVVIATKDYLPGDLILEEKPILLVPKEYVNRYRAISGSMQPGLVPFVAYYWWFVKRVNFADKERILTMFVSTNTDQNDSIRLIVSTLHLTCLEDPSSSGRLSPEQVEIFVKLFSIMNLNGVGLEGDKILYFQMSHFAHSCGGNSHYEYAYLQTTIRLRAVKAIRAGEEITYAYLPKRDLQPIAVRREAYLQTRGFTCHCPRCDALGDDTRQFDCCDPVCSGIMLACEPRTRESFIPLHQEYNLSDGCVEFSGPAYSGVEYVEPHLLPCTKCHRTAPAAYQRAMFARENKLPALAESFSAKVDDLPEMMKHKGRLLDEISRLGQLPRRHALVLPILHVLRKIHTDNFLICSLDLKRPTAETLERGRAEVQRAVDNYFAAQEAVMPWPHVSTADALWSVCNSCVFAFRDLAHNPPVFTAHEAKALLQKTLRMFLILNGRNERHKPPAGTLDEGLLETLEALEKLDPPVAPPVLVQSGELCAFCEESPLRAAMKRTRCGACKKVMYCSAGCQKAHWKLHKKTCKA